MTARYPTRRATLANGQPAHTRHTPYVSQPPVPSVRFIGDPVERDAVPIWRVIGETLACVVLIGAALLAAVAMGVL